MIENKIQSTNQDFRLIPQYRKEIDVRKLCQVLIMAAKNMNRKGTEQDDHNNVQT